jgi:predicted PurR-regulated permease PerM
MIPIDPLPAAGEGRPEPRRPEPAPEPASAAGVSVPDPTHAAAIASEADAADEAPRASRAPLTVIALILGLVACWLARDLLVPVMLAMMLALLANPMVTRLNRMWIPRWIGALLIVLGGLALAGWLASLLVAPATDWIKQAPTELRQVAPKFKALTRQVEQANKAAASIAKAAGAPVATSAATSDADKPHPPNLWSMIAGAPRVLASIGAVVLLAYFFLVYGQDLQRHAIARMDGTERKQVTIEILKTIEADLSRYVLTISFINAMLGLLLTGGLVLLGLDWSDALLWGTLAALLNFVPYVGPLSGVLLLGLVGLVAFNTPAQMLVPPAMYLGLHVLESQVVTPIILGRRMALSPLVMLLWLMLWGFLWGIAGLLLAVPMLASLKIVAERVERWQGWAKVIE